MDTTKFDVILDASSETFIEDLKKALGLKPGEALEIVTPQFERTDGRKITYRPRTAREYDALPLMEPAHLKEIGCQIWDKEGGNTLWLYPHEWYEHIPAGYEIVDIRGNVEPFVPGETDDDMRYGALAFGFLQAEH